MAKTAPLRRKFLSPNFIMLSVLIAGFVYYSYFRFFVGFDSWTNLSPTIPMGLAMAFKACGVALSGGAFTLCIFAEIFGNHRFHPLLRPALLVSCIGYTLVGSAVAFDLGRWYWIWHAIIYWNGNSVLFEIAWCVMLYLTVLVIENVPNVIDQYKGNVNLPGSLAQYNTLADTLLGSADKVLKRIMVVFVLAGVTLSFGHQSSLGTMMLIGQHKLHPLWLTAWSPLLFVLSAMGSGLPMVISERTISNKVFGKKPQTPLLADLARYTPWILGTFLALRIGDLLHRGVLGMAFEGTREGNAFLIEICLFIIPCILLSQAKIRENARSLFLCCLNVILAVIVYRFNVFLIGWDAGGGWEYFPSTGEIAVCLGFLAIGAMVFRIVANYLPIMQED